MCSLQLLPSSFCSNKNPFSLSMSNNFAANPLVRLRLGAGRKKCGVSVSVAGVELPEGLEAELMPKHVAVIMDGNRRWAKNRVMPVQHGHKAGGEAFRQLFRNCLKYGIKVVTVFAFSTENWIRPQDEVEFLMNLLVFNELVPRGYLIRLEGDGPVTKKDLRVSFIGSRGQLPEKLQKLMSEAEEVTKENKKMHAVVAMNYSGRYDITEATRRIARKVRDGVLQADEIDDGVVEKHLQTHGIQFPNPDLVIRSSGELRVSNFMLWQLAYSELFFTDKQFPDFDDDDLIQAFAAYQKRQRRFGGHKYTT